MSFTKVPLNNKETMLQRQISIDKDDPETGLEALEEPLKAKKPKEIRQGILGQTLKLIASFFFRITIIIGTFS